MKIDLVPGTFMLHRRFHFLFCVCVAAALLTVKLADAQETTPPVQKQATGVVASEAVTVADAASTATTAAPPKALSAIINLLTFSPGSLVAQAQTKATDEETAGTTAEETAEALATDDAATGEQDADDEETTDPPTSPPGSDVVADAATSASASSETETEPTQETPAPKPKYGPHNPRQVRVTIKILEWTHSNSLDWGFSLLYLADEDNQSEIMRAFDATFPKPSALNDGMRIFLDNMDRNNGAGNFEFVIDMLEQDGDVTIINEPTVVIKNAGDKAEGETIPPAKITTETEVPFEQGAAISGVFAQITQFDKGGINLTISDLEILSDDFIRMKVDASVTDFTSRVTVALNEKGDPTTHPTKNTRSIKNTILVANNSLFITGILKTTKIFDVDQGVPILSRIPILKYFTSNKHKSDEVQELIFLVQPRILNIENDGD